MQPNNLQLNYLTPVVTMDGHVVIVSDQGVPTLIFFQGRNQQDDSLSADVVAAVRMNSLDDLKNLNKAIEDTIKKHKDREP
jgi:hypothetical protein